jgi:hypothetical protein
MIQPMVMSGAVEKPNSSAPSSAAIAVSRPVRIWPSAWRGGGSHEQGRRSRGSGATRRAAGHPVSRVCWEAMLKEQPSGQLFKRRRSKAAAAAAPHLQHGASAQVVGHQRLVGLSQAQLPREAWGVGAGTPRFDATATGHAHHLRVAAGVSQPLWHCDGPHLPSLCPPAGCLAVQGGGSLAVQGRLPCRARRWPTCKLDGGPLGSAGAAVVAADEHMVGVALDHTARHNAHAVLGHELDRDAGVGERKGWGGACRAYWGEASRGVGLHAEHVHRTWGQEGSGAASKPPYPPLSPAPRLSRPSHGFAPAHRAAGLADLRS